MAETRTPLSFNVTSEQKEEVRRKRNIPGILALGAGILIHSVYGSIRCWGNFNSYTPAHLKNLDGQWDPTKSMQAQILMLVPVQVLFMAIAMPLGSHLNAAVGPRVTTFIAGVVCCLAPLLSSIAGSLFTFALLYAGLLGIGVGLGYTIPLLCSYKHFPDRKGLCSGIILMAFGVGGFIFNKVGTAFLNPNGLNPDPLTKLYPEEVTDNFGCNFRKLSIIYLAVTCVASVFINAPPEDSAATAASNNVHVFSVCDSLRLRAFWIMWVLLLLSMQVGLYVSTAYKSFAFESDPALHDDLFLAHVGAMGSLSGGMVRPGWGLLYDRFGFRVCMSWLLTLQTVWMLLYPYFTTTQWMYLVDVVVAWICQAGLFTMMPGETYKLFGNSAVYGALYTAIALSGIVGVKLALSLEGNGTFWYLSATSLLSVILLQFLKKPSEPTLP